MIVFLPLWNTSGNHTPLCSTAIFLRILDCRSSTTMSMHAGAPLGEKLTHIFFDCGDIFERQVVSNRSSSQRMLFEPFGTATSPMSTLESTHAHSLLALPNIAYLILIFCQKSFSRIADSSMSSRPNFFACARISGINSAALFHSSMLLPSAST